MRIASGRSLAVLLLIGLGGAAPALAQQVPQGSYLRSCTGARVAGETLSATCRRTDGREDRTALNGYRRCVGDIGNINGTLQCATSGGGQLRGEVMAAPPGYGERNQPGYGGPGYAAPGYPAPGYPAPGYGAPGYGAPGYGAPRYGGDPERCRNLWRERDELAERRNREWDPVERERIDHRLHQVREQLEPCR